MIPAERRAELRELLAKLPEGPWKYQEEADAYTHIVRKFDGQFIAQFRQNTTGEEEAKARLLAFVRSDLPALLDALDAAEARERRLREALRALMAAHVDGAGLPQAVGPAWEAARAALAEPPDV